MTPTRSRRTWARPLLLLVCLPVLLATQPCFAGNPASRPAAAAAGAPRPRVVLETVRGDIVLELHPEDAPLTVANFTKLVKQGFYDSLTFHRVVPGFVIQGGDPNSRDTNPFNDGEGGPGYTVPAEIQARHVKGAVAMARKSDAVNPERASSGSQFYIALRDLAQLDGGYTVFGQVVSGWATIDSIVALAGRKDIARQGNNANPGTLALIRHARMLPATRSPAAKTTATGAAADSSRGAAH
jgi:cyclophilin family peptidyl-prolyl cis-trans isomerase